MSSLPNSNSCAGTFGSSPTNPGLDLTAKPRGALSVVDLNLRKVFECYQKGFTLTRQREELQTLSETPRPQPLNRQFEEATNDVNLYFDSLPEGYRFCPTDEELIVSYLKKKVMKEELPRNKFKHINIYKHNPEELAAMFRGNREKEFYFFTPREKKYPKGNRPNRAAGGGYWKATGADKTIKFRGKEVGSKKSLVFYRGKPPHGDKTNWIMQEYRVKDPPPCKRYENDMRLDEWVLCKIYKKTESSPKEKSKEKPRTSFHHENSTDTVESDIDIEDDQNTLRFNAGSEDYQALKPPRSDAEAQDYQAFKPLRFNADYQAFKPPRFNAEAQDYQTFNPPRFNADYQAFKPSHVNAEARDYQALKQSRFNAEAQDYQAFKQSRLNAEALDYQAFKPSRFDAEALDYQAFKPPSFNAEAQDSRFFNAAGPVDYQAPKPSYFNPEAGTEAEEYVDIEALNSSYSTSMEMEIGEPPLDLSKEFGEDNFGKKIF